MHDRRVCLLEMGDYCVIDGIVAGFLFVCLFLHPKLRKKTLI